MTAPLSEHLAWCDLDQCDRHRNGQHYGPVDIVTTAFGRRLEVQLTAEACDGAPTDTWIAITGIGIHDDMDVDYLELEASEAEDLAGKLTAHADQARFYCKQAALEAVSLDDLYAELARRGVDRETADSLVGVSS